jgi:TPR repeat protein
MTFAFEKVRGVTAPFSRVPRTSGFGAEADIVKLADYLEQKGIRMRDRVLPPVSFWDAVLTHAREPDVCAAVGWTAERREYYRVAATLFRRAAEQGHLDAAHNLAWRLRQAGHDDEADSWLRSAAAAGHTRSVQSIEFEGERSKNNVYHATIPMWKVAAERDDLFAIGRLASALERTSQFDEAELWWRRGADLGDEHCIQSLTRRLMRKGDDAHAEELLRQLVDTGDDVALWELIDLLIRTGREEQVRVEWEHGFNKGCGWSPVFGAGGDVDIDGICELPVWDWLHELADAGNTLAMRSIARRLLPDPFDEDEEDDPPDDETLGYAKKYLIAAVEAGDRDAPAELDRVPQVRAELDDAAAAGDLGAILNLANRLERDGSSKEAERWWRKGVAANNDWAVTRLAALLRSQGRPVAGDDAIKMSVRAGITSAHLAIAEALESGGRLSDAESHFLEANAGFGSHLPVLEFLYRHGRLRECERRARDLIQIGSSWHGDTERAHELLDAILRSTGRPSEADRVKPFGFEPDGSTADAW